MKLKFYERTKNKLNLLFSSTSNSNLNSTTTTKTTPTITTTTKKQTPNQTIKKKGKEYNGVEVDEESPMLEEVVAPSKYCTHTHLKNNNFHLKCEKK